MVNHKRCPFRTALCQGTTVLVALWVLKWSFVAKLHVPCDVSITETDDYTGQQVRPFTHKEVFCEERVKGEMSRKFYTERELEIFKSKCPKDVCHNWKIEKYEEIDLPKD